jgi:hypothetical protein
LLRYNSNRWENWSPNFLTAESDTLQTVTSRGSSTTTGANFGGNVGIGTTSPASKLHTEGANDLLTLKMTSGGYNALTLSTTFGGGNNYAINPYVAGVSNGGFEIKDLTNNTSRIVIAPTTGNVLIGTTTDAGNRLQVNGSGRFVFRNDSSEIMDLAVLTEPSGLSKSKLSLLWYGNETTSIKFVRGQNSTGGQLEFWTQVENGSIAERMRITSGGNVLIGTTTDVGSKLYVDGTMRASGALVSGGLLEFTGAWSASPYNPSSWIRAASGVGLFLVNNSISKWAGFNSTSDFIVNSGDIYVSSSSGNVGIGTTSPASKLSVGGDGYAGRAITATANNADFGVTIRQDNASGAGLQIFTTQTSWGSSPLTISNSVSNLLSIASTGAATFSNLAGTGTRMVVADANGLLSTQAIGGGAITGSGTTNYVPKFTGASTIGDSVISDTSGVILIGGSVNVNGENTHIGIDATGGAGRVGFVKKSGLQPFLAFAADPFLIAVSNSTTIAASNTFSTVLSIATSGAATFSSSVTAGGADGGTAIFAQRAGGVNTFALNTNADSSFTLFDHASGSYTAGITQKSGNVGIGTTNPQRKLQITDGEVYVRLNPTDVAGTYIVGAADGKFYIIPESTFVPTVTLSAGNVGIGTTSPQTSLTLNRTNVGFAGQLQIASDNFAQISFYNSSALTPNSTNRKASIIHVVSDNTFQIANQVSGAALVLQGSDSGGGNVLIGTTNNTTNGGLLQVGQVPNSSSSSIGFNNNDNAAISARYSMTFQVNNDNNISGRVFDWRNGGKGYTDGTLLMTLNASGNLGLGVTPSAWNNSTKALQISNASIYGSTNYGFFGSNIVWTNTGDQYISNGFASVYGQISGEHRWYIAPSGTAGNAISFTQAMTLDANGDLQIGTSTSSGEKLTVYGSSEGAVIFQNSTSGTGAGNGLYLGVLNSENYLWTYENQPLIVGTNNTERLRITSGGNLLLGLTSDFGYLLSVNGTSYFQGAALFNNTVVARNATTAAALGQFSVMGAGEFMSTGALAGYFWENRSGGVTSSSNWYGWYTTSGVVHLYNGSVNLLGINGSTGAATFSGSVTAEDGLRSNRTQDALSGMFLRSTINGTTIVNNGIILGKTNSSNNASSIVYTHTSDGSALNRLGFGFWANDNLLNILANGNVGIGTTAPAAKLDVDSIGYSIFANNSSGNRIVKLGTHSSSGEPAIQATLSNNTARYLMLNPDGGNVLIGTTADNGYKLRVNGKGYFDNNVVITPTSESWAEGLSFVMPTSTTWGGLRWRRERAGNDGNWYIGFTALDATDDLVFGANNGGAQVDNIIRLTKAGNVGIGNTSPGAKLVVQSGSINTSIGQPAGSTSLNVYGNAITAQSDSTVQQIL